MTDKWPKSEADMAAHIGVYLREKGWDMYPEVRATEDGPIADWVAVHRESRQVGVIECKTSLTVRLMRQAHWWLEWANWVSVALPGPRQPKHTEERDKYRGLFHALNIGVLHIYPTGHVEPFVSPHASKLDLGERLLKVVRAEHKEAGVAGAANQSYTAYGLTVQRLREFVVAHPGCSLKEAIPQIDHHYQSDQMARQKLTTRAEKGELRGIKFIPHTHPMQLHAS